jgi:cell shape-determining protein MreC
MELIPKDKEIEIGEVVITSGIEPNIPKGLVIGEIAEIVEPGGGFLKTAYLKPLISLDKISIISVLIPEYINRGVTP